MSKIIIFVVWTLVALIFILIGVNCLNAKKPVGFFTFIAPPKISKEKTNGYNRAVAILWFSFAGILEVLGMPVVFCEQNSPIILFSGAGVMFLVIGLMIIYLQIEKYYRK